MTEDSRWAQIDEALGLRQHGSANGPGQVPKDAAALVEAFTAAGFRDEAAARGVAMMSSGRYFGFVDAATALAHAMGDRLTPAQEADIRDAGRAYNNEGPPQTTPWGRPIEESQTTPFGRPVTESQTLTPWGRPLAGSPEGQS